MTDEIRLGTMLIEDGSHMPAILSVSTEHYSAGWSSIMGFTSAQLGKEIEKAGWTFFYMAGEIRTSGFGFSDQSRMDRALAYVIEVVEREHCNCLEITKVRQRSCLGLHWTSLIAHARHIQKSWSFYDGSRMPARTPFRCREWLYDHPTAVRTKSLFAGEAIQTWENEGGSRA
jgi:hypothetical protein